MAKKKSEEYTGDSGDDNDYEEEPNFDDPEGFVDDVPDEGKAVLQLLVLCQHSMHSVMIITSKLSTQ